MASPPRWLEAINKALSDPANKGKIIYQVATVDNTNRPRVRSQVHRGFFNPDGRPDLPLLVTSTDVRSPKVDQIQGNQRVELAWWMDGSQDQFRISAIIGRGPDHNSGGCPPAMPRGSTPTDAIAFKALDAQGFDWDAKKREVFDKMSPRMRASWCIPCAPGSPLASQEEQKSWPSSVPLEKDAKSDDDRKNIQTALSNFALMMFEPIEVDWVALGVQPNRRTVFRREGEKWVEQLVVP